MLPVTKIQNHQHLPGHQISEGGWRDPQQPCMGPALSLSPLLLSLLPPSSGCWDPHSCVPGWPLKDMLVTRAVHAHSKILFPKLFHKNYKIQNHLLTDVRGRSDDTRALSTTIKQNVPIKC